MGSWGSSLLVHTGPLILLGLWTTVIRQAPPRLESLAIVTAGDEPTVEPTHEHEPESDLNLSLQSIAAPATAELSPAPELGLDDATPAPPSPTAAIAAGPTPSEVDVRSTLDRQTGSGFEGRAAAAKATLVRLRGGTEASEAAVARGLRWLAAHQRPDGSWNFNHQEGACQGTCRDPGGEHTTTGATALALLPFLGAGHTHRAGEFKQQVHDGLYYLTSRMTVTPQGGDLQEGTMYAQGLATIALCEAYALTGDRQYEKVAQRAVDFVLFAQDKTGGGWRYFPGQLGDMSVTGWQFMALKSGQLAYLRVPGQAVSDAVRFLDGAQAADGARYGYRAPDDDDDTMSAVGLLCRMYTGWDRTHPALRSGVERLAERGPSKDNLYYDYYATQVLHHWDGPLWKSWNDVMREWLIATQAREGHEAGSWHFPGETAQVHVVTKAGGRLYSTALAIMTLEVYYRHMPLYTPVAFGDF